MGENAGFVDFNRFDFLAIPSFKISLKSLFMACRLLIMTEGCKYIAAMLLMLKVMNE